MRRLLLTCLVLLLAGSACAVPGAPGATATPAVPAPTPAKPGALADLAAARARWDATGLQDYTVSVTFSGMETCRQDFEVRLGQVKNVTANTCTSRAPALVPDLFAFVETQINAHEDACGPNGCACDILHVDVRYHTSLGYPQTLRVLQTPPPGGGNQPCTLIGFVGEGLESVVVTPLR